jgi:hypothetical protein
LINVARLVLLSPVLILVSALLCPAQTSQPKTVLDYYKLLPDKFFEADRTQRMNWMLDPKRGAIVDSKNGYLYAPGDGAQTDIYLSLFQKRAGGYLAAVKYYDSDTQAFTHLEFYVYQNGSWTEVTKSVIPGEINYELKYEMPRYGTAIRVKDKRGKRLYDLVWAGEKFRLRK